ncbi:phosphate ABC transporter substrate-binding protein [Massilia sp.]|uniref:phosphate ABC transporter substrate-binding protein n=1 Tax=Massilia sp. TaxID=1882437 RepID=UPI00289E5775|nr:phosphate ABC transporter substrate-binding protein [Massilia sp.]
MNRLPTALLLGIALGLALPLPFMHARASDLAVIVSARSTVVALSPEQVAEIFLAQSRRFPDGSEVVAIDQNLGSPLRDRFYGTLVNRSPALMKAYWSRLIFTGRGQPPAEVNGSAAMRKLIAENPGMIGYVERSAMDSSVREVLTVR